MWKREDRCYICEKIFILLKIHIEGLTLKNATGIRQSRRVVLGKASEMADDFPRGTGPRLPSDRE